MSAPGLIQLHLADEQATARLARHLAPLLTAGDTILLEGPIGAGKTHFCRHLIQTRLGRTEDVPSPTFTLVQTYDADVDVEIWHADLYRLTHPDEAQELGLEEAFASAICLIEWPERLGSHTALAAIKLTFSTEGDGRRLLIDPGPRPEIRNALQAEVREGLCMDFLAQAGWGLAKREALGSDASARRYERLFLQGDTRLLMDAPPDQADSVVDFVHIARHLRNIGLSAPRVDAEDLPNGLLLIEDLGDGIFAKLMLNDPVCERALYAQAVDVLAHLQSHQPVSGIPTLTLVDWAQSANLVVDWYCFAIGGARGNATEFTSVLQDSLARLAQLPQVMILRDFHAENLMWLPDRVGLQRVGLLDFQLAQMGQPGYDLVSLLQDARRDVSPKIEAEMIHHFLTLSGHSEAEFLSEYACLGALRALRILGIFARLCLCARKPGYVALITRVWAQLQRNLAHPALLDLQRVCDALLPPPTAENLERIKVQCGHFQ